MPEILFEASFWLSVGQIIMIDILLGGDNAVVIALACRQLPEAQRRKDGAGEAPFPRPARPGWPSTR